MTTRPSASPIATRLFARAWIALSWLARPFPNRVKPTFILSSTPPAFIHVIGGDRAITLRAPTRWLGALRPKETYRETQPFHFGLFSNALNHHLMFFGTAGVGKSMFASTIPLAPMLPARAPADYLADLEPWNIGADEALDERHPLIACAFLQRARLAEESHGQSEESDQTIAEALSDAIAGRRRRDGLHPDFAKGLDHSSWARAHIPRLLESALPLARAKRERDAIAEAASERIAPERKPMRI